MAIQNFWEDAGYEVKEWILGKYSIPGYGGNAWYAQKYFPSNNGFPVSLQIAYKDNGIMTFIFDDNEYNQDQALRLIKLKAFL